MNDSRNRLGSLFHCWTISVLLTVLLGMLFAGCGAKYVQEMALTPEISEINLEGTSICLLAIKTDNQFKPGWPPEVYAIELYDEESKRKFPVAVIKMSATGLVMMSLKEMAEVVEGESSKEVLISFQLLPGRYRLTAVRGGCIRSIGVGVSSAGFDFPFDMPFQIEEDEYVYLGRVEMINRERASEDEVPSGGNIAVSQGFSGFGTGTFDVTVSDEYEEDMRKFREKYPVLASQEIKKRILPPWSKPEVEAK